MSSAYNNTRKWRKGLLCCLLALLRKSWTKCWMGEFVKLMLSFLRNRRARLGSYFSGTESSESVTNIQLLFLWDGRVPSDTLTVFVSWQLHNISLRHVVVARFYIVYCQSKRCIVGFHFCGSLFCVDFVGSCSAQQTFSVQRLLHSKDRFLNEFWFLFHWIRGTPALWKFWQSFTSPLEHISLCPCSLVTRNGLLLNHTVFKSASAVELPKRSFSNRTWISSSFKAAEALGLLPLLPFRFRSLCFDGSTFRVCSNWTSFIRQSP